MHDAGRKACRDDAIPQHHKAAGMASDLFVVGLRSSLDCVGTAELTLDAIDQPAGGAEIEAIAARHRWRRHMDDGAQDWQCDAPHGKAIEDGTAADQIDDELVLVVPGRLLAWKQAGLETNYYTKTVNNCAMAQD